MSILIKVLSWLLTLTLLGLGALVVLVFLDSRPLVPEDRTLSAAERAWAREWLVAAKPHGLRDGERITLTLSEREANIIGNYLIDKVGQGRVDVRLTADGARVAASLGLPWDPEQRFVNLDLSLAGGERLPRIEQARLAGLPLPENLVQTIAERLVNALDQARLLHHVDLQPDLALLTYEWHRDALANLGSGLVSADERARILTYQHALVSYAAAHPKPPTIALADLLAVVLSAAQDAPQSDPAAENRAAILALAAYANQQYIRDPDQPDAGSARTRFRPVALLGRGDLAQHFMTSAALAAQGGTALSDLVGLFKEVADSRGGSGFSFADLAADRAGTRFANLATGKRQDAQAVQAAAREGLTADDLMPAIDRLPEGMNAAAFAAAFQDTKSPAYRSAVAAIERDIDALRLFQKATR
jgi:hypothetical protein